jgi:hypothetical protein
MTEKAYARSGSHRLALGLAAIVVTVGALTGGFLWSAATPPPRPTRPAPPPPSAPWVAPLPTRGTGQS